jgi:hypothetical protein
MEGIMRLCRNRTKIILPENLSIGVVARDQLGESSWV